MIIDKIQISGQNYDIRDTSAVSVVNILQAEYDELPESAKTENILYNITDAQPVDISQYWTSAQTNSAINEATSGKLDTSVYTAYTAATDTALANKVETSAITTSVTTASTDSEMIATLHDEDRLRCISIADKWYKVITEDGLEGYVYISYTTDQPPPTPTPTPTPVPPPPSNGGGGGGGSSSGGGGTNYNQVVGGTYENTIANIAESMLGVSYVWGACSNSAVDCSGLVCYCYGQLGVSLPHQSQSLCSVGVPVAREDAQPGDIVCWDTGGGSCGHVGIYVGGGQCIDARGRAWGVVYGDIDRHPILTIRRIYT